MDMRTRAATGAAEKTDLSMFSDPLARRDDVTVKVAVDSTYPVPVIDFDDLTVVASIPRIGHDTWCRGVHRGHIWGGQIEARVKRPPVIERIVTRAEAAFELIMIERHRQWQ